ncbi:MAG: hypothetical protein HFJ55_07070 [Clostridia bacterium]|nr:hypothetical protein [Clostridia bacterium]
MVKRVKIKESIFCYWCSIYEEEYKNMSSSEDILLNKVLISEVNREKYQQRIFLEIENNTTQLLETGTEVNFIEIHDYIADKGNEKNKYKNLNKYLSKENEEVLLIGIKMRRGK